MLTRLGPAPLPLLCALLVVVLVVFGALVPIGHQGQRLSPAQAIAMVACAAALGAWAIAVAASAWTLTGVERAGTILAPTMSPGVFDLLFSLPLVVVVPASAYALLPLLHGRLPGFTGLFAAAAFLGLLALREADRTTYVRDDRVQKRIGWLFLRRESAPLTQVRGVRVDRDFFRGAPSYVVKLDLQTPERYPRLVEAERRYRSVDEANAEAERWRLAMGQLGSKP